MSIFRTSTTLNADKAFSYRLHVDDNNHVWSACGTSLPLNTSITPNDYFNSCPAIEVMIMGTPANASLVVAAYEAKQRGDIAGVKVCSPAISSRVRRQIPEAALFDSLSLGYKQPSTGGWHDLEPSEYPSYVLATASFSKVPVGILTELVEQHPIWPHLSFVRGVSPSDVASLIGTIIDPRWFVNPQHPDSVACLQSYLGLLRGTQYRVIDGCRGIKEDRFRLIRDAWKGSNKFSEDELLCDPRLFLWRTAGGYKHDGSADNKIDLVAGQRFIKFMRAVWLQVLYPTQELFVPEYFFHRLDEATAYREHVSTQ